jgi:hypothetical protein
MEEEGFDGVVEAVIGVSFEKGGLGNIHTKGLTTT